MESAKWDSSVQSFIDNLYDGVYMLDRQMRITFWSAGAERISGYLAADVIGKRCSDNILMHVDETGRNVCLTGCPASRTLLDGQFREAALFLHHRAGHRVPLKIRVFPLRNAEGRITGVIEVFRDQTDVSRLEERLETLEKLAMLDPLTQLGNRRFIEDALRVRLAGYKREETPRVGVLFVDIDHFKRINDTYGHAQGDDVLRMVAQTMRRALREFDVLGRWGGEEFVVLVLYADEAGLTDVAERLRRLVEQSWIETAQGRVSVTISVGGSLSVPGDDLESLIARADAQMYRSKREGRNRVSLDVADLAEKRG